jgi:hypothetical protein
MIRLLSTCFFIGKENNFARPTSGFDGRVVGFGLGVHAAISM